MKSRVVAYVLLYLLTSQTFVDAQQISSTFTVLRRDAQLDDDVTCHDVVVSTKFACAATCLHDDRCRVVSACVRAAGKSSTKVTHGFNYQWRVDLGGVDTRLCSSVIVF